MKANESDWTEEKQKFFYGKWSGLLEIAFPNEGDGILPITMENGYVAESRLRMPHEARETGYEPSKNFEDFEKIREKRKGYFLRVRVRKRNDQIIEANYAKINEEILFDPRGSLRFTYYFNPTVNDRNP